MESIDGAQKKPRWWNLVRVLHGTINVHSKDTHINSSPDWNWCAQRKLRFSKYSLLSCTWIQTLFPGKILDNKFRNDHMDSEILILHHGVDVSLSWGSTSKPHHPGTCRLRRSDIQDHNQVDSTGLSGSLLCSQGLMIFFRMPYLSGFLSLVFLIMGFSLTPTFH